MTKMIKGNHPKIGEGYDLVFDLGGWAIYRKDQGKGNGWSTYRIVAKDKAERKGNYWLVRNDQTGQMGFVRDIEAMKEHRPELYERVMAEIEDYVHENVM
ncbi:hypothetical protein SLPG_00010 [Salicola phage CGphi29]|uniref:hypothetical protein n=1 Tax=Salicola phage CGphi29 TaxID=754067 RepID=UPI0002C142E1|nr:hypothetical protein SLPG_00010 [Salicola phage CGphi29]AGH31804.1 hypothetical protein SLPG_00010 [Salicola phage CGphi29]